MGKLLFPRRAIDAWISENSSGIAPYLTSERPNIFLGSHDPLLDWALREARCNIATNFGGSFDGVEQFQRNQGIATGLHIYNQEDKSWNVAYIEDKFKGAGVVLVEWALRQRGLLTKPETAGRIASVADLKGRRVVPRQKAAGSQMLLEVLLAQAGVDLDEIEFITAARTETDSALAVNEGKADAAFGLQAQAQQFGLAFVPIIRERFDLLINRRAYFEPPLQTLLEFCCSEEFSEKAKGMIGYDVSGAGRVRFNG